ncbi:hypothetical protein LCGC14_1209800 [marine sediment metagenome]|uniref:Uncharacterized protein n=1 Tax=marine sediment metagenome TaxID=412755 RepID=A0A0F9NWT1_9ZZZZ
MARSRNIKPGFFKNEQIGDCSLAARLLFVGLWTLADYRGVLECRPRRIGVEIFPFDRKLDIEKLLTELQNQRLIALFRETEKDWIHVCNFTKHQNPHKKEREAGSTLPDPTNTRPTPGNTGASTELAGLIPDSLILIPDSTTSCPAPLRGTGPNDDDCLKDPHTKEIMVFPIKGDPRLWHCPQSKVNEWCATFGDSMNVVAEIRRARQWLLDNPTNQKTARGMVKFLNGWIGRAQNRGTGMPTAKKTRKITDVENNLSMPI